MSSITNIPINTRSMNGIITISDGVATLENGDLSNINNLDATSMTTTTQPVGTSNDLVATTEFVSVGFVSKTITNVISAINTFTNNNTFTNLLTMNAGFNSLGQGTIRRATANVHLRMIDTTFNSFGDLYTRNQILFLRQNLPSSLIRFQLYNALNVISDVFTIGTDQCLFNISVPIRQNGLMPSASDNSNQTPTTSWTQSAITANNTSLLSSVNTWTQLNTFSRPAGNMNLRLLDSTNNTTFTGAVGNNQINLIMSNNDSKIYLNTFTPAGIQTNTLLVNSTTTSLNTTNPLVQTATMPSVSDNSTYTPTTSWCQSLITFNIGALLNANNSWGGSNTFSQQVNANNGIVLTNNGIVLTLPSAQNAIQIIDATSLNSNILSVNGNAARYIINGLSSVHNFFVRDSANVQVTAASLSKSLVTFNSDSITWSGTDPAVTDATGKLATTRFVNSKQNNFLTLNNIFTGTTQFNNQVTCQRSSIDIPLVISSSSTANYKGNQFISNSAGSYNPIVSANEYVIFGSNTSAIDLSTLCLTTHSSTGSGIKISNNLTKVFGANEFEKEIKTSTTDPPASQCLGHIFTVVNYILPSTFNWDQTWNGTTIRNLYSYTFDNSTNDKKFGTYRIDAQLVFFNSTAQKDFIANINEISTTTDISPFVCVCGNTNCIPYSGQFYYTLFISFTKQIYGNTTFYLNCKINSTGGTGDWTSDSYIRWTRIA